MRLKRMRSTFRTPFQKHALVKSTYAEDYDYSSAEKEKIRKQNVIKGSDFMPSDFQMLKCWYIEKLFSRSLP